MPRRTVNVRLTEDELAGLDHAAGEVPRERYIRRVLADAVAHSGYVPSSPVAAVAVPERAFATGHRAGCRCLNCERALGRVA